MTPGEKVRQTTPELQEDPPSHSINRGKPYRSRSNFISNMSDLSAAISSKQQAIHLTPEEHTTTPTELADLGDLYFQRWQRTGSKADISQAILCLEKAVNLTPADLNMPVELNTL